MGTELIGGRFDVYVSYTGCIDLPSVGLGRKVKGGSVAGRRLQTLVKGGEFNQILNFSS